MPDGKHTEPSQPLAIKAQSHNVALCFSCGLFFNWMFQTKHDGCPECNSKNWIGAEEIRRRSTTFDSLLNAAKDLMEFLQKPMDARAESDLKEIIVNLDYQIKEAEVPK